MMRLHIAFAGITAITSALFFAGGATWLGFVALLGVAAILCLGLPGQEEA